MKHSRLLALAASLALPVPLAAQFTLDPGSIPSGAPDNASYTENVDFADVDLDGDWDIGMADGGDFGNDQNRIWINQGGLQGGVKGFFLDETATRFPLINDTSRDIEFADFDSDGDPDVFVADSVGIVNQPSRFWINLGQKQGGVLGVFVDETQARWVGLGAPGSSVPPSIVLPSGGFLDWTHDADFADLDNDGDLDLIHVSQGGAASGQTPTRMFLNDGDGYFTEFNPSGFMLSSSQIKDGDPGLWCEGVQMNGTLDVTGAFCDIATVAEDADLGDIDGDFDVDLLLGDRTNAPRMFANRLDGSALAPAAPVVGTLLFRDVTAAVFPAGYVFGQGNYEQELGDLDGDGDLDLLGVDWGTAGSIFDNKVFENDGAGHFGAEVVLPGPIADENEGDFLDFDSDGDLDIFLANFSGQDRLFRNETAGAGLVFVIEPLPVLDGTSYDADAADLDGDGDPEVLIGNAFGQANELLHNGYDVADVHAPTIPKVESVSTPAAFSGVLPVRAHVFDNAAYYVNYFNAVELEIGVNGVQLPPVAMTSSGGQVFRGELPGNLVGQVLYRIVARDEYGNTGTSSATAFTATGDAGALYGSASPAGTVQIASLSETHAGASAYLHASGPAGSAVFLGVSLTQSPPVLVPGLPNLVLNLAPPVIALASGTGDLLLAGAVPAGTAGVVLYAQALAFDGATFESSPGLALTILP